MRSTSTLLAGLFAAGIAATPALAIDLSESVDVAASPADAWAAIAEWCSISTWHPVIAECEAYEEGGKAMRKLTTGDGGVLIETLTAQDDGAMSFSYAIVESPLPIADYQSTMAVAENGDGATVTWSSSYHANGVSDEEALELMAGIYRAGLDQLKGQLD
ncbi:MAG: SRPBCC family protein [Alphaproteobacteria bacterium]|nr:SRPBCC family protein [Alphaproteobacteria bacterium]